MSKKDQILRTALKLFVEKGFEKTPSSRISSESEVATGTLFHHFKSKNDLLFGLFENIRPDVEISIKDGLEKAEGTRKKLLRGWHNFILWVIKNPLEFQFIVAFNRPPYSKEIFNDEFDGIYNEIFKLLESGKAEGIIINLPMELLKNTTKSQFIAASQYFIENPEKFSDPDLVSNVFASYWYSLAVKC